MASSWDDQGPYDPNPQNSTVTPLAGIGAGSFELGYEAVACSTWWLLFLAIAGLGISLIRAGEYRSLQRWPLYILVLVNVALTCVCESLGLGFTVGKQHGRESDSTYLGYIFFWHASSASFLVLLLALSSGYCITKASWEGFNVKVLLLPAIVFIAGVASDFTFVFVLESMPGGRSAAVDTYDVTDMSAFESMVWVFGTLANIMCFILAWVYVFENTQNEIKALDAAQEALQRGNNDDEDADSTEGDSNGTAAQNGAAAANGSSGPGGGGSKRPGQQQNAPLGTTSQRVGLLYGMDQSHSGGGGLRSARGQQPQQQQGGDEEEGGVPGLTGEKETVADYVQYTVRKRLLMRFYWGVCGYLVASIMVLLLPAFFVTVVQNAIVVLQFVVKYLFTAMLAYIFRPGKDSPYLQVGFNEADADDKGVGALDTELAVADHDEQGRFAYGSSVAPAGAMRGAEGTTTTTNNNNNRNSSSLTRSAASEGAHAWHSAGGAAASRPGSIPPLPVSRSIGPVSMPAAAGASQHQQGGQQQQQRQMDKSDSLARFTLDDDE